MCNLKILLFLLLFLFTSCSEGPRYVTFDKDDHEIVCTIEIRAIRNECMQFIKSGDLSEVHTAGAYRSVAVSTSAVVAASGAVAASNAARASQRRALLESCKEDRYEMVCVEWSIKLKVWPEIE